MYEDNISERNKSVDFNEFDEEINTNPNITKIKLSNTNNDSLINEDGSFILIFDANQFMKFLEFLISINKITGIADKKNSDSLYISVYSLTRGFIHEIKFVFRQNKSLEIEYEDKFKLKMSINLKEEQSSFKFRYTKDLFEKLSNFFKNSVQIGLIANSNIITFSFFNDYAQFSINSTILKDDVNLYNNEINDYFLKSKNCVVVQDNLFNKFLNLRSLSSKLTDNDFIEFYLIKSKLNQFYLFCSINLTCYSERIYFKVENKISSYDGKFESKVSAKQFLALLSKRMKIIEISLVGSYLKMSDETKNINKLIYVMSNN